MRKKNLLRIIVILTLLYPAFMLFNATGDLGKIEVKRAESEILNYQISVWVSWIILVSVAIYYKWTRKKNFFFLFTYAFVIIGFGIFGYLSQNLYLAYELPNRFEDNYTFGLLLALQNILISSILTGFLQAASWWFTRRWHRR